jgi:hypothetical protein
MIICIFRNSFHLVALLSLENKNKISVSANPENKMDWNQLILRLVKNFPATST